MKRKILSWTFLLCSFNGFSQNEAPVPPVPANNSFTKGPSEAMFPGDSEGWLNFLKTNVNTEIPYQKKAAKGTYKVVVHFKVNEQGKVSDIKAETNFGFGMEKEAIRVMNASPKWIPAKPNGKNVESYERRIIQFIVK